MAEQEGQTVKWAQVVATIFLGVVGLVFTYVIDVQQEENRKNQMAVQIMSQREQSEIDFRQKMFGVLVAELLDSEVDVRERVTRLKLFQHNFHDIFNGRALFDVLEAEARNLPKKDQDEVIKELVSLAKEVTEAQELLVGAKPEISRKKVGDSFTVHLGKPQKRNYEHGENHTLSNEGEHEISIKLIKVKAHAIEVEVIIDAEKGRKREFEVSYFDEPLTDNTLLPDRHRFAITLKETNMKVDPHEATLSVFEFPADYVTTGYRPSIREANRMFRKIQ